MIIPLFKPVGASSHLLAQRAGEHAQEPASHTGTLDPMAQGVLVVATGEDRYHKSRLSGWRKEYQLCLVVGIETDTHDCLGQITKVRHLQYTHIHQRALIDGLNHAVSQTQQAVHQFSAKRHHGRSYFDFSKQGVRVPTASVQTALWRYHLGETTHVPVHEFVATVVAQIKKISGAFRQDELVRQWKHFESSYPSHTCIRLLPLQLITSKRYYVRSLVRDLALATAIPMTAFNLTRTQNGPFSLEDCVCLVQ